MHKTTRGKYNSIDLSYMAGWIDGEGTICITKVRDKRKKGESWQYILIISVANLNKETMEWVRKTFSPQKTLSEFDTLNGKRGYQWQLRDRKGLELIKILFPYLKAKKRQAEIAIKFGTKKIKENKRGVKLNAQDWQWREEYRLQLQHLNLKKGNNNRVTDSRND